jgi:hypothetical protein
MPTLQCKKRRRHLACQASSPIPLKTQDFSDLSGSEAFLCRATKYSLRTGVRHRRVVEIKKKQLSFEIAVTNPIDARTYFWMNFQGAGASLAI